MYKRERRGTPRSRLSTSVRCRTWPWLSALLFMVSCVSSIIFAGSFVPTAKGKLCCKPRGEGFRERPHAVHPGVWHWEVFKGTKDAEMVLEDSAGWKEADLERSLPPFCHSGVVPNHLNYAKV